MKRMLPITREQFESIIKKACKAAKVDFREECIIAAINYFHSLDRDVSKYCPKTLAGYLRRAHSNEMTFDWVTEIRHRREAEQAAQMAKIKAETPMTPQIAKEPPLSLVETPAKT